MADTVVHHILSKIIKHALHTEENENSDELLIVFTDGTSVKVYSYWHNDGTAGLKVGATVNDQPGTIRTGPGVQP